MKQIEKYGMLELEINYSGNANLIEDCAIFRLNDTEVVCSAFWKEKGTYAVRFLPEEEGAWSYQITIEDQQIEGEFQCVANKGDNHGRVVTVGDHFAYEDGTRYIPIGTTCYAWIHQTKELQEQTIETLKESPFNKIRMCVFPKSMPYNNNDPDCYPFFKDADGQWDVQQLDSRFWDKLDKSIEALQELGIETDLIIFHPYDRWGFAALSQQDSMAYLKYCNARLGAYRNLWWSLANEFDTVFAKTKENWDEYGTYLMEHDNYHHLCSIHHMVSPYPKRKWMTHCSMQSGEINKVLIWKKKYQLPVIIDECGYEGDIDMSWGNLSAFEMVNRFWWTICRGGFCTHGETFHREDEVLWWAKGGKLYGESPKRIAFMKEVLYRLGSDWKAFEHGGDPNQREEDKIGNPFFEMLDSVPEDDRDAFVANTCPMKIVGDGYSLEYFGRNCPIFMPLMLEDKKKYKVECIDVWDMTITEIAKGIEGHTKVDLPGKEGIAILISEM